MRETVKIAVVDECLQALENIVYDIKQSTEIVVIAQSNVATEAVEIVQRLDPDILLLASNAPDRGLAVLKDIVKSSCNTKIVVLALSNDRGDVLTALRCGASGYILRSSATSLKEALMRSHKSDVYVSSELGAQVLFELTQSQETVVNLEDGWLISKDGRLSEREREIIILVRQGCRNKEIASKLQIQEVTVKKHLSSIFKKLRLHSRSELTALI